MTPKEKKKLLLNAFWDKNIDADQLYNFINGKIKTIPLIDQKTIFIRLLSTYDWYTLIKLFPLKVLKESLSDDILNSLYPKELKKKYQYARKLLFK